MGINLVNIDNQIQQHFKTQKEVKCRLDKRGTKYALFVFSVFADFQVFKCLHFIDIVSLAIGIKIDWFQTIRRCLKSSEKKICNISILAIKQENIEQDQYKYGIHIHVQRMHQNYIYNMLLIKSDYDYPYNLFLITSTAELFTHSINKNMGFTKYASELHLQFVAN